MRGILGFFELKILFEKTQERESYLKKNYPE